MIKALRNAIGATLRMLNDALTPPECAAYADILPTVDAAELERFRAEFAAMLPNRAAERAAEHERLRAALIRNASL